jgi:DNA polymerase-3 subunit beta
MRFEIARGTLLKALAAASAVVDPKGPMPVLANVLLEVNQSAVVVSATDLHRSVCVVETVDSAKAGSVCADGKSLKDRVAAMPDGTLKIESKDNQLVVRHKSSKRRFTLSTLPAAEFPALTKPNGSELSFNAVELSGLLGSVRHAVSTDDSRPQLSSLLLRTNGGRTTVASTDGHRLSVARRETGNQDTKRDLLIPRMAIPSLLGLCDEHGSIEIYQGNVWCHAEGKHVAGFVTPDAQFPPWEQVVPESSEHHVVINRADTLEAAKAIMVAADNKSGGMCITFDEAEVRFDADSHGGGCGTDSVPVESSSASKVTIGVNGAYLVQALDSMAADTVRVEFSGELDPVVITETEDRFEVLMPMRV